MTGIGVLAEVLYPAALKEFHRARVLDAFDASAEIASEATARPRVVFTHVMAPHSPQVFAADGSAVNSPGLALLDDDREEAAALGPAEYDRRLEGQVAFVNARTLRLVDEIVAADPDAVVVVFSDHGSKLSDPADGYRGADMRTANLLSVRSPGQAGIIDDRSTLANILPRLLRAYTGTGPPDVAESIHAWVEIPGESFIFRRPD